MAFEKCSPALLVDQLVGTWKGQGKGSYPEIDEFNYLETLTFKMSPKGFLAYSQVTTSTQGAPMHQEVGYLRVDEQSSTLELIIAQPTGIAEVLSGEVLTDGSSFHFELCSVVVAVSPSAKEVTKTGRYFVLESDELSYQLYMEAVGQQYQLHLDASLTRADLS